MSIKKVIVILAHALVGWGLCFATIGIGMAALPEDTALIIHAVAAPVIFAVLSYNYFTRFAYTSPLATATIFTAFVLALDFFLVALVILKSTEMFTSLIGTWIPFALIFGSTYVTGWLVTRSE